MPGVSLTVFLQICVKEELWLRFQFLHLIEVDSDGQALSNTTFPEYGFSLSKGRLGYQQTFDFSASLGNRTVGLNYSLYSNETYVSYGNVSLLNRPGTNKWNLLLSGWTFAQPTNRLEIYVGLSVQASVQSIVGVSAGSAVANQRTTRYVVQTTHTTSTMDLADFALADVDVDRPVQHRFEAADTLVLSLPTFTDRLSYDPNIGLLLRDQGNGDECSAGSISLWILCLIAAAPSYTSATDERASGDEQYYRPD
ncbi:uncharacterized protein ACA1_025870 [Acanthamoeba castellanii str. Neff]|uniref:Uncharacterized protein n=1 Tax=Acanthamoeba castellanii (strain ATCC 30010 / Neff) TaxID=1257118 RepID=L8HE19_ACACF|nr:uncharacterized protein ACA1_025870 [Acanthamoeba castellanii str. Neff]ELR23784.1 hypothetical protein ACA1_025870 [Acanthamoeba castellanii str. Neff]